MKIVVACDSFKGSLDSNEVAEAVRLGLLHICPDADIVTIPVADGGEGTAAILTKAMGGEVVSCKATDPLGRPITASYGIAGRTAIIDVASASGLTLIKKSDREIMRSTTFGTGQQIADAYSRGCRNFIIGLGGSATCDGGAGMLSALGCRFSDSEGVDFYPTPNALKRLEAVNVSALSKYKGCNFTVLCDVDNPLCGPEGSAHIFAAQKGASSSQITELDNNLCRYAGIMEQLTGHQFSAIPGAGAAGGLGAAFAGVLGAGLQPGVQTILKLLNFDNILEGASLIITGEGKTDRQTLNGKLPYGVLLAARKQNVPVVAIAGITENRTDLLKAGFADIQCINPQGANPDEVMLPEVARRNIILTVSQKASEWLKLKTIL